jgi:hypothetical protein
MSKRIVEHQDTQMYGADLAVSTVVILLTFYSNEATTLVTPAI